jgi:hypothetical protein
MYIYKHEYVHVPFFRLRVVLGAQWLEARQDAPGRWVV